MCRFREIRRYVTKIPSCHGGHSNAKVPWYRYYFASWRSTSHFAETNRYTCGSLTTHHSTNCFTWRFGPNTPVPATVVQLTTLRFNCPNNPETVVHLQLTAPRITIRCENKTCGDDVACEKKQRLTSGGLFS